jgi:heme exporter protein D
MDVAAGAGNTIQNFIQSSKFLSQINRNKTRSAKYRNNKTVKTGKKQRYQTEN